MKNEWCSSCDIADNELNATGPAPLINSNQNQMWNKLIERNLKAAYRRNEPRVPGFAARCHQSAAHVWRHAIHDGRRGEQRPSSRAPPRARDIPAPPSSAISRCHGNISSAIMRAGGTDQLSSSSRQQYEFDNSVDCTFLGWSKFVCSPERRNKNGILRFFAFFLRRSCFVLIFLVFFPLFFGNLCFMCFVLRFGTSPGSYAAPLDTGVNSVAKRAPRKNPSVKRQWDKWHGGETRPAAFYL